MADTRLLDMHAARDERTSRPSPSARTMLALSAALPILLLGLAAVIRIGLLNRPPYGSRAPWTLGIALTGFAAALTLAYVALRRAPELHARARGLGFDRRAAALELATLGITAPAGLLLATLGLLQWARLLPAWPWFSTDPMAPPILAALGVLVAGIPQAVFSVAAAKRTREMEERFPDLLRDLNESHSAGMTMAQAVRVAARGDYGRLDDEVRRMSQQVSWGASFQDALRMFAQRVPTPLVTRAVSLVDKATRAGGDVRDVLAAAARDARAIKALESERRAGMAMYVIVVYVSFGVFLAVTAALQGLLVPSILGSTQGIAGLGNVRFTQGMTGQDFRFLFFGVGLVQAIGSGIVAGVMSEGDPRAGLKHAAVMTGITMLVLGFLV